MISGLAPRGACAAAPARPLPALAACGQSAVPFPPFHIHAVTPPPHSRCETLTFGPTTPLFCCHSLVWAGRRAALLVSLALGALGMVRLKVFYAFDECLLQDKKGGLASTVSLSPLHADPSKTPTGNACSKNASRCNGAWLGKTASFFAFNILASATSVDQNGEMLIQDRDSAASPCSHPKPP